MSYGTAGRIEPGDDVAEALQAFSDKVRGNLHEDAASQLDAAQRAAQSLIESGEVGEPPFQVTISGHANPGHGDTPGWANDHVTVSINRLSPDLADDPTDAQEG